MASYQDIDIRLKVVEEKLDFIMKTGSVAVRRESKLAPGNFIDEQMSLIDLYRTIKHAGGKLVDAAVPAGEEKIVGTVE